MPELSFAARMTAGPGYIIDPDLAGQARIDARIAAERPRLWTCCLCQDHGAGGLRQAHAHYMIHHYEPPEASS